MDLNKIQLLSKAYEPPFHVYKIFQILQELS